MIKITNLILVMLLITAVTAFSQAEFLVTVNPETGDYTKIDEIPGVMWISTGPNYTVFNEVDHQYMFRGSNNLEVWYLYTINVNPFNIVSNPEFPVLSDSDDNLVELHYDNVLDTLFALHWDNSDQTWYFISVNPKTGEFVLIDSIPGLNTVVTHNTCYDENNHRYIFKGAEINDSTYLYSIDANTGNLVSKVPFPLYPDTLDNLTHLQYSNLLDSLYGLYYDYSESTEYLVSVDIDSGTHKYITSIPNVKWITSIHHYTVFDEVNNRFIFRGGDNDGIMYLYSIDVISGEIISSPVFPNYSDNSDFLSELKIDNTTGIVYALLWDAHTPVNIPADYVDNSSSLKIYPNPISTSINIELGRAYNDILVFIYNIHGQMVKKEMKHNSKSLTIQRDNLNSGIYFISVICDNEEVGFKKILFE